MKETRTIKRRWLGVIGLKIGVGVFLACSGGAPSSPGAALDAGAAPSSGGDGGLTYYANVKPIVDAKCAPCHYAGGIAPFPLLSYSDVMEHAPAIGPAVASHTMPPWPPADDCNAYKGDRSLSAAEIATLTGWVASDRAEGDPSTYVAVDAGAPPGLSRVDAQLQMPEAYTPQQQPDDYRCFLLDWDPTTVKYIVGFGGTPGQPSIVHHLLAYIAPPDQVATYEAYDTNDPGPGYTCFGGPTGNLNGDGTPSSGGVAIDGGSSTSALALPQQIGGWVPGSTGSDFPAGTGIRVDPGSKIVLQVHYNTLSAPPVPDQTSLAVELADSVDKEAYVVPFTDPSWVKSHTMDIPAGDPDAGHAYAINAGLFVGYVTNGAISSSQPFTLYSSLLHMHLHGTETSMQLEHADGSSTCLLEIPHWNFHWQGTYALQAPVTVQPSDQLDIGCHWDNSSANQPVIDGQPTPVADLNWGEGTTDEMCIGFVYVTQ